MPHQLWILFPKLLPSREALLVRDNRWSRSRFLLLEDFLCNLQIGNDDSRLVAKVEAVEAAKAFLEVDHDVQEALALEKGD